MLKDIDFIGPRTVAMRKKLWSESELSLARCLQLEIIEDATTITVHADLTVTDKKALFEFIKECFRNFATNPNNENIREDFKKKVLGIYNEIYTEFYDGPLQKAGYQDKFFKHQRETLAVSAHKKYNFFAFEQGLGKTITSATVSKIYKIKRTVVICPSLVKWNWFRDLTDAKWGFNELYFTILDAAKSKTVRAFQERFVIVNYEMLEKFCDYISKEDVGHIIIDEAQNIKNHNSARFKNVKKLIEANPNARVTFLSGTPIKNRVNDVFAYLKLAHHPLGDNYSQFLREFTSATAGRGGAVKVGGGKNLNDLFLKMSNFMIRKTKAECLDLPPKTIYKYRFELEDYREEYNNIIHEMAQQKDVSNLHSCLHSLNIVLAKAKIKGIIEMANTILEQGRKVIIFSSYKEPLNMLEEHFRKSCVKIDGSVPSHMRDTYIQKFLTDDNVTVFLGNMIAAGVGINLVNASDIIFTNFPFVPADLYQAEDRSHRIGQVNNVNIYYTMCEESIDEYLYELITDKAVDINAVIDNGKDVTTDYRSIPDMLYKHLIEKHNLSPVEA